MKIIFMGTPDFAVPSLQKLLEANYEIAAVVTSPDRPAGRGRKLQMSAVKKFASQHNLPVLQPEKLKSPDFLQSLQSIQPDLMVVVAFRKLPKVVWSIPKIGTFNLHAALLPDYRGAAPINWVVINGEKETGATTFFIDSKIDHGEMLLQRKIAIPADWTAGDLHDALMEMGADLVLDTVKGIEQKALQPQPQDHALFQHKAPKIFKEQCEINWNQSAESIYNFIRGLSPYPTAWTTLNDKSFKIFKARLGDEVGEEAAGSIQTDEKGSWMKVACQDRFLQLDLVQLQGKKRMTVGDFLRGYKEEIHTFTFAQ